MQARHLGSGHDLDGEDGIATELDEVVVDADSLEPQNPGPDWRERVLGRGAGRNPAASSVIADIVDVARTIAAGSGRRIPLQVSVNKRIRRLRRMGNVETRYYLRFTPADPCTGVNLASYYYNWNMLDRAGELLKPAFEKDAAPHLRASAEHVSRLIIAASPK